MPGDAGDHHSGQEEQSLESEIVHVGKQDMYTEMDDAFGACAPPNNFLVQPIHALWVAGRESRFHAA